MLRLRAATAALVLLLATALPAHAARTLIDSGKWDNYFALYARNTALPWKRISLRLDTYSGAAVEFAAYEVDPADVLVAGTNARPRAVDTAHLTPVAKWRFSPPPGLKYESNDVEVPLQNREGFFVVEARRGDAVQQVWLNLSRIGLVTKESPAGSLVYAADLQNGRALAGMRLSYLVGVQLVPAKTDAHGISRVPARARFALAEWARSKAFVSLLPPSPPAAGVVGVRADRASVRAGERVRVVGFARKRNGSLLRPAAGEVAIALNARGRSLASGHASLDRAGAFSAELAIPANTPGGDAAIVASTGGTSGGATIHVDAVGDLRLTIAAPCSTACPANAPFALTVNAKRGDDPAPNADVRVRIVRSPHVLPPDAAEESLWGTTAIIDAHYRSDALGAVRVQIPAPTDGLASTYGVSAAAAGSTATTNLVAPTARVALAIAPERDALDVGQPATFTIRGFDPLDGAPAARARVRVRLVHGPTEQAQSVDLGADGLGRVTFRDVALGMNLAFAETDADDRHAVDVTAVSVALRPLVSSGSASGSDVRIALGKPRQRPGERVEISATLTGAVGDALITMESGRGIATSVVGSVAGAAAAGLSVPDAAGVTTVGAAFVRDGAIQLASVPLVVDGPGRQRAMSLTLDKIAYAPGATAKIAIDDGDDRAGATLAIRLGDRRAGAGAAFDDLAGVLASRETTTQNVATSDPPWHTSVAPARSTAGDMFGLDRPRQQPAPDPIAVASARVLAWRVERAGDALEVPVPREPGRYVLAVLKMTDDGDVGTATVALTVQ